MRALELRRQRRAQRTSRNDVSVADTAHAIDHQDGKVFGQRRVLEAVIHHDDGRTRGDRVPRARGAIARHDRRSDAPEQQRLVADVVGAM